MTKCVFLINHNIANSLLSTPTSLSALVETQNPGREMLISQAFVTFSPQLKWTRKAMGLLPSKGQITHKGISPARNPCVIRKREWLEDSPK